MPFFKKMTAVIAVTVLGVSLQSAKADIWGDIARVVTAPVTAPAQLTIRVLKGDNPKDALGKVILGPTGRVIERGSQEYQKAQDMVNKVPRKLIQDNLGGDWVKAYDILTASQRVQYELATTAGRFLGKCLQGQPCSIEELTAAPLAAALRDAYKQYIGHSGPLDPRVGHVLSFVVPLQVLQVVRLTVGATPDLSVPGMLNAANDARGNGHAVTIGNLIIFSRPLNFADLGDWNWLLHELRHVEQYMSYSPNDVLESIDGFAVNYAYHFKGVEADAQNTADQRQGQLNQICQFGC